MAQEKIVRKEVFVDFDGTGGDSAPQLPLLQEDAYDGEIVSVDLVDTPAWDSKTKTVNRNELVKKIVFQVKLFGEESQGAILPHYANPVIKKAGAGGKGYSNSKLYDILVSAGVLDLARHSEALETFQGLSAWLGSNLKGRKVRVLVGTANKGTERAYSSIKSIVRFEAVKPVAEKV